MLDVVWVIIVARPLSTLLRDVPPLTGAGS